MRVIKKFTGAVCALALCLQSALAALPAAAEQTSAHTQGGVAVVSLDNNDEYLEHLEKTVLGDIDEKYLDGIDVNDDPSYIKFVKNQQQVGVTDFNSLITHQDRFSGFNKLYGIDVSVYNGDIDFDKVKAEGYQFVIVRAGARGYGSAGTMIEDSRFEEHVDNAHKAGLMVGAYYYTQAVNKTEVKQEVDATLKKIGNRKLEMPVYFDIEPAYDWNGKPGRLVGANLSKAQKAELCKYFCDLINNAGYTSGVTSCKSWFECEIDMSRIENIYDVWLAHYTTNTNYASDYNMWQFNSTRKVNGVYSSCTDQDVRYVNDIKPSGAQKLRVSSSANTVVLSWDATINTKGYIVYRQDSAGNTVKLATTSARTYSFPRESSEYKYYIRSYNYVGGQYYYSGLSNIVTVTGKEIKNLKASGITPTTIPLQWSAVTGASGYCVYMDDNFAGYTNTNSFTIEGLAPSTQHKIKVSAFFNKDGSRVYSSDSFLAGFSAAYYATTIKPDTSLIVKGIKTTAVYQTSITISWNAVTGASGYCIYMDDKYRGYCYATSFTLSGLAAGTQHKIKVSAYFNNGVGGKVYNSDSVLGGYSDAFFATTLTAGGGYGSGGTGGNSGGSTTPTNPTNPTTPTTPSITTPTTALTGRDRYATAVLVSQNSFPNGATTVVIASGSSYADALVAAPLASSYNAPVLLTSKDIITETTLKEIERLGAKNAYVIGGEGVISRTVDNTLKAKGLSVYRVYSSYANDRYGTAVYVSANMDIERGSAPTDVFIAYSQGYADTLAVNAVAALKKAPILYMDKSGVLDGATKYYLDQIKSSVKNVYIIGGTGVISSKAESTLKEYGTVKRIAGSNRYETCLAVNKTFAGILTGKSVCFTTGQNYPDALAGGVLAAKNKAPVVIADGELTASQKSYLSGRAPTKIFTFGGCGASISVIQSAINGK